jgi:hypothetical protein
MHHTIPGGSGEQDESLRPAQACAARNDPGAIQRRMIPFRTLPARWATLAIQ